MTRYEVELSGFVAAVASSDDPYVAMATAVEQARAYVMSQGEQPEQVLFDGGKLIVDVAGDSWRASELMRVSLFRCLHTPTFFIGRHRGSLCNPPSSGRASDR